MKLSIRHGILDYATFERLFTEAWNYISAERQRLGADVVKQSLWDTHENNETLIYEENGYIVGAVSFSFFNYNGNKYFHYLVPTFGENEEGSRAWFYSDEYNKSNEKLKSIFNDIQGVLMIGNPNSPAMTAIQNKVNNGTSAYTSLETKTVSEVFGSEVASSYTDEFRVFIMGV